MIKVVVSVTVALWVPSMGNSVNPFNKLSKLKYGRCCFKNITTKDSLLKI